MKIRVGAQVGNTPRCRRRGSYGPVTVIVQLRGTLCTRFPATGEGGLSAVFAHPNRGCATWITEAGRGNDFISIHGSSSQGPPVWCESHGLHAIGAPAPAQSGLTHTQNTFGTFPLRWRQGVGRRKNNFSGRESGSGAAMRLATFSAKWGLVTGSTFLGSHGAI